VIKKTKHFRLKIGEQIGVFDTINGYLVYSKAVCVRFPKKRQLFRGKLTKIAENSGHYIDPRHYTYKQMWPFMPGATH
jgi:hypothetical protein